MIHYLRIIMYAAPIGTFGAMAFAIGKYGIGTLASLFELVMTFYATAIFFVVVVLGIVAAVVRDQHAQAPALP